MAVTTAEIRAMADRLSLDYHNSNWSNNMMAAAMLRKIADEWEAQAQQEYDAGRAQEEYGTAEEGSCLYGLYAEHRQFASQEPPRRNERGGWDYSV